MAKKTDEVKTDEVTTNEAEGALEKRSAILNPRLDIGSYTFSNGETFETGVRRPLTEEEYAKYSEEKYRGKQVVIRP
jgi:hypothetical protein